MDRSRALEVVVEIAKSKADLTPEQLEAIQVAEELQAELEADDE